MIVGAVGFSWSGSSAVSDLLMEFDNTQVYKPEFFYPYYPDCLEDLDYHLNDQCSKFISSTIAIQRFKKTINRLLYKQTNGRIVKLTEEYVNNLVQARWVGRSLGEEANPAYRKIAVFIYQRIITRRMQSEFCREHKVFPLREQYLSIMPDDFEEKTQKYIDGIMEILGLDLTKTIVLDQPFPGNDPQRSMRYFRDSKAIIVDRDPRDIYMIVKKFFKNRCYQFPDKIDQFIPYYAMLHKPMDKTNGDPNVLHIRFENLVYNYQQTVNDIIRFLDLGEHISPKKYFVPEMSMANTRLFEKCTEFRDDIAQIENKLSTYLFDFSRYKSVSASGIVFDNNPNSISYDFRSPR